jgi:hypothetical protein
MASHVSSPYSSYRKKEKKRKERKGRIIYALNDYEQKCLRDWREKELKTVTI